MTTAHEDNTSQTTTGGCCGSTSTPGDITEAVRERYSGLATQVLETNQQASCCDGSNGSAISKDLYLADDLEGLPLKAALASLGCGHPTALVELRPGETVLDLGSGGGIDVLLSARRVGPQGFVYGLDMTDEMLELARGNAAEAGATNVEFLKGDIAAIPLPDNSVDVIISNCVINLAEDKEPVLREALRVLRPGGRFAVSDIVIHGGLPTELVDSTEFRRNLSAWAGCIAGALTDAEYRDGLTAAGFAGVKLEVTRRFGSSDLPDLLPPGMAQLPEDMLTQVVGRFASTFVRAQKPE
ncbi:MAG: methyltransferase domain-containing protein [Chloroflexi bacterium AL-W]|nr:methyltransferase domain-containing protein [Chloroflexi bacterium AL-N1]NOK69328.1 methyltransferase domain-containing protein [Chloroflexi bacterium AL-N10]NOK76389.1 methyltransferase domain-containing protein [Chloroflexi bacterium AL-N5]NOK83506.1 methyltransferase domain-containing protein [Chloroflexi bacterium AL-W]NOK91166.1 methyltransferase domain-containing protein [Chloroflexi bacterium AL-N15]